MASQWSLPTTHTVASADGTPIDYLTQGRGAPLIIVPGVLSTASDFARLAHWLSREFTVHSMNRRGRAGSGPQGADYSLAKECDDLHAVMKATGAHFVFGHSYGGLIALELARNYSRQMARDRRPGRNAAAITLPFQLLDLFTHDAFCPRPVPSPAGARVHFCGLFVSDVHVTPRCPDEASPGNTGHNEPTSHHATTTSPTSSNDANASIQSGSGGGQPVVPCEGSIKLVLGFLGSWVYLIVLDKPRTIDNTTRINPPWFVPPSSF